MSSSTAPGPHLESGEYVERLLPSAWVWVVVGAASLCVWVIVLPVDDTAALVCGLLTALACTAALITTSPVVGVRAGEVVAGRAHVPLRFVAAAEALDRGRTRDVLGPHADARALLRIRPWVNTAVRITLDDPTDPVPAWIVSTRRPEEFAGAVAAAKRSSAG